VLLSLMVQCVLLRAGAEMQFDRGTELEDWQPTAACSDACGCFEW
jgi:hypothetical protein